MSRKITKARRAALTFHDDMARKNATIRARRVSRAKRRATHLVTVTIPPPIPTTNPQSAPTQGN